MPNVSSVYNFYHYHYMYVCLLICILIASQLTSKVDVHWKHRIILQKCLYVVFEFSLVCKNFLSHNYITSDPSNPLKLYGHRRVTVDIATVVWLEKNSLMRRIPLTADFEFRVLFLLKWFPSPNTQTPSLENQVCPALKSQLNIGEEMGSYLSKIFVRKQA